MIISLINNEREHGFFIRKMLTQAYISDTWRLDKTLYPQGLPDLALVICHFQFFKKLMIIVSTIVLNVLQLEGNQNPDRFQFYVETESIPFCQLSYEKLH